jgi:polar amino acid transport system substrate-binding protein
MLVKRLIIGVGIGLLWMTQMFAGQTIKLVTADWEPYVRDEEDYHGYVYEIVHAAFAAAGYQADIQFLPWSEAVSLVEQGEVDGIFPKYMPIEPEANLSYSQPFSGGPLVLYKRKDSDATFDYVETAKAQDNPFTQLTPYTVGVVAGYGNVPEFDRLTDVSKRLVKTDRDNLYQLFRKEVDFIFIDKYTAMYLLENILPQDYEDQLEFVLPALAYRQLHVAFVKDHPHAQEWLEAFNRGLLTIRQNGVLDQIIDRDARLAGGQVA